MCISAAYHACNIQTPTDCADLSFRQAFLRRNGAGSRLIPQHRVTGVFRSASNRILPSPETPAATAAGVFPSDIDPFIPSSHAFYPSPLADAVCVSPFGLRKHPISGKQKLHKGIDFAAPEGEPIYALSDGIIRTAAESSSYGNYIILEHADGLCSLYAHCKKLLVRTGSPVKAGQTIAQVGETGAATGAHLHLELWRAGKLLNPEDYIAL